MDLMNAGRQYRQAGDLPRAEAAFRELLTFEPTNPEAWQSLGSVCRELGKQADALAAFQRAVTLDPEFVQAQNSLGIALLELGQFQKAAACLEQVVRLNPEFAVAYNNLGNVYLALDQKTAALEQYQHAVRLAPQFAEAHGNLGNVLRELGHLDDALASCRLAVQIKPGFAIGHNHLGAVYSALRRWEEAEVSFRQAISLQPRYPEAHANRGDVLRELRRFTEAEAALREALRLRPQIHEAHLALGLVLREKDRLEAAEACCREALRLQPDLNAALQCLGMIYMFQRRPEDAVAVYQRAVELAPDEAGIHRNLAIALLLLGHYDQGWIEYEWRWRCAEAPDRDFGRPKWDGGPLFGNTILLHAEQGLGDTLQFIRYARAAREQGGRVIVSCQAALVALLRGASGVDEAVPFGAPVPPFDVHAGLMDLPGILKTRVDTIPADTPYLEVDTKLVDHWRNELSALPGLKVGLAWQGNPSFRFDQFRSIRLEEFAPLADVRGLCLVSLQRGFGSEQIEEVADRLNVIDLASTFSDLNAVDDLAAVVTSLDLVVSVDSFVAHLAGALGIPVWLLTPYAPDWRWFLDREDSPWYPTMRLFRQQRRGDWQHVFRRIASCLAERTGCPLPASPMAVEIAPGELLDKITILQIKSERIADPAKLRNVRTELASLTACWERAGRSAPAIEAFVGELKQVNEALWEIEDQIRIYERDGDFGPRFIELARSVYRENNRRAAIKRSINEVLGSRLIEEKSYGP